MQTNEKDAPSRHVLRPLHVFFAFDLGFGTKNFRQGCFCILRVRKCGHNRMVCIECLHWVSFIAKSTAWSGIAQSHPTSALSQWSRPQWIWCYLTKHLTNDRRQNIYRIYCSSIIILQLSLSRALSLPPSLPLCKLTQAHINILFSPHFLSASFSGIPWNQASGNRSSKNSNVRKG